MIDKKYISTFEQFNRTSQLLSNSLKPLIDQMDQISRSFAIMDFNNHIQEIMQIYEPAQYEYMKSLSALNVAACAIPNIAEKFLAINNYATEYARVSELLAGLSNLHSPALLAAFGNISNVIAEASVVSRMFENLNFNSLIEDIRDSQREIPYEEFEIDEDFIQYEGNTYNYEDIENIIKYELEQSGLNYNNENILNHINIIILQGDKPPLVKLIFTTILVDVIKYLLFAGILFITPVQFQAKIDDLIKNESVQRQVVKDIKKKMAENDSDGYLLKDYRFVVANILIVREQPARTSKRIGELRLGSLVQIIKKKNGWALVQYSDGDTMLQGWVFLRYLEKFD